MDSKATGLEIPGSLLTRNSFLNLVGLGLPLAVALVTVPFVLRGLGVARFGVLSLVWILLNYFTILDLGLNRALTKFVAEALGRGDHERVPALLWTTVVVQTALGVLGGVLLAAVTPLLAERVLHVPPELLSEAETTLYLLAASVPAILVSSSFRGVLEASQRFDLVNAISVPSNLALYLLPATAVLLGFRLPGMMALFLATKVILLIALFGLSVHALPILRHSFPVRPSLLPPLLNFGGWITVSSIVGPIMRYLDRFIIASLHTVGAVAYYTVPFDLVERFWIVPASIVMTLFPAFSALTATRRESLEGIQIRTIKYLLTGMGPILLLTALFADDILRVWLGAEFALKSTPALRILVLGAVIGMLAPVPGSLLQGVGRPDLIAFVYLGFLLPNAVAVWYLVEGMGIVGAALSFACRTVIETGVLFYLSWRKAGCAMPLVSDKGLRNSVVALAGFGGLLWPTTIMVRSLSFQIGVTLLAILLWAAVTWYWILDAAERKVIATGLGWLARADAR